MKTQVLKPHFPKTMRKKILKELDLIMEKGWIGEGAKVKELEEKWAKYTGAKYAVATNSCTSALDIAVRLAGFQKSVTVSAFTFISSALCVKNAGYEVNFVDIDEESFCTPKADIQVMYAGNQFGEGIIYDMAHSGGVKHKGLMSCWSFHAVKNLPCVQERTRIKTKNGDKRASDIKIGDFVLTHKNRYRRVIKVMKRAYGGAMIHIGVAVHAYYKKEKYPFLSVTPEHPILVRRSGTKQWIEAKKIKIGDKIFVPSKKCLCGKKMPYFATRCNDCPTNQSAEAMERNGTSELYLKGRWSEKKQHSAKNTWDKWINPAMQEYENNGFRCIPVGHYKVVPDFIAIKDKKVVAVEIEHGRSPSECFRSSNPNKYNGVPYYDKVDWIVKKPKNKRRIEYRIDNETGLAEVSVSVMNKVNWKRKMNVYNYEVEGDNSYTAGNIVVHNCGDGGMLTTNDPVIYQRAKAMSWCGISKSTWARSGKKYNWDYEVTEQGLKAHMNDITAVIALEQFKVLDKGNAYRKQIAETYNKYLPKFIRRPYKSETWHLYTIRVPKRNKLFDYLANNGVGCGVHYKPLTHYPIFGHQKELPNTEKVFSEIISLPIHLELKLSEVKKICLLIKKFYGRSI